MRVYVYIYIYIYLSIYASLGAHSICRLTYGAYSVATKEDYLLTCSFKCRPIHESEDHSRSLGHARLNGMGLLAHVLDSNFTNNVLVAHLQSTLPSHILTTLTCEGVD